jgi:hypothetical protein
LLLIGDWRTRRPAACGSALDTRQRSPCARRAFGLPSCSSRPSSSTSRTLPTIASDLVATGRRRARSDARDREDEERAISAAIIGSGMP